MQHKAGATRVPSNVRATLNHMKQLSMIIISSHILSSHVVICGSVTVFMTFQYSISEYPTSSRNSARIGQWGFTITLENNIVVLTCYHAATDNQILNHRASYIIEGTLSTHDVVDSSLRIDVFLKRTTM